MENTTYNFDKITHHEIVRAAIVFATKGANDTNHRYGDASYTIHLALVADVAYRFIHLIPMKERANVIAACWLHDTLEDHRISYNDMKRATNKTIAELAYAVTNEKGRNRAERANVNYYKGIRETEHATFVKLCDRIANIEYGGKSDMYAKENIHFKRELYDAKYDEMFKFIDWLLEQIPTPRDNRKNGVIVN